MSKPDPITPEALAQLSLYAVTALRMLMDRSLARANFWHSERSRSEIVALSRAGLVKFVDRRNSRGTQTSYIEITTDGLLALALIKP